jgi:hypothetical protein
MIDRAERRSLYIFVWVCSNDDELGSRLYDELGDGSHSYALPTLQIVVRGESNNCSRGESVKALFSGLN